MSSFREQISEIFNKYNVRPDDVPLTIRADLRLDYEASQWSISKEPRFIKALDMSASQAMANFIDKYKVGVYRKDKVAAEFYKLTDEQIVSMMEELPYYLATIQDPKYQISAARFLAEKIWENDYPAKPKGVRRKAIDYESHNWDSFLKTVDPRSREAFELYKDRGMTWGEFKDFMKSNAKKI